MNDTVIKVQDFRKVYGDVIAVDSIIRRLSASISVPAVVYLAKALTGLGLRF